MSLTSLDHHVDRDDRHRARVAAGTRAPKPVADPRVTYWGGAIRHRFETKAPGAPIPTGCIVIAARRDEHGQVLPVLTEAFEGDRAGFASFPRLALMLGATELQICQPPVPGRRREHADALDRVHVVFDLARSARCSRAALLSRPLAPAGAFDRAAIMATACAVAKARQGLTGEAWAACLSAALKGVWTLARAARLATAH